MNPNNKTASNIDDATTQRLLKNESERIVANRVNSVLANQDIMNELSKSSGANVAQAYTIDVKALSDALSADVAASVISSNLPANNPEFIENTSPKLSPVVNTNISESKLVSPAISSLGSLENITSESPASSTTKGESISRISNGSIISSESGISKNVSPSSNKSVSTLSKESTSPISIVSQNKISPSNISPSKTTPPPPISSSIIPPPKTIIPPPVTPPPPTESKIYPSGVFKKDVIPEINKKYTPNAKVTYRSGAFWRTLSGPMWNQPKMKATKNPPSGTWKFGKTPKQTLQIIPRGASVPAEIITDVGTEDIIIHPYENEIKFLGGGQFYDISKRLNKTTQGVKVEEEKIPGNKFRQYRQTYVKRENPSITTVRG